MLVLHVPVVDWPNGERAEGQMNVTAEAQSKTSGGAER